MIAFKISDALVAVHDSCYGLFYAAFLNGVEELCLRKLERGFALAAHTVERKYHYACENDQKPMARRTSRSLFR